MVSIQGPCRDPGEHLLAERGGLLRHAPPRTRGTQAACFPTAGQEPRVRTGGTAQADTAMGQEAAWQRGGQCVNDIRREACSGGIGREGGQKGVKRLGHDLGEDSLARSAWHRRGW
jgi:hypothetical protein